MIMSDQDLFDLVDSDDDNDSLTDNFNKAANHVKNLVAALTNEQLLKLYGLYKQGTDGKCQQTKPSWYDLKAKSKWEAWQCLGDMSKNCAKQKYVEVIQAIDVKFSLNAPLPKENWITVSLPQMTFVNESEKTIVDYIKEENFGKFHENFVKLPKNELNNLDMDGLGLVHWASDRGCLEILKFLLEEDCDVNLQDVDGQTALHYACSCGHLNCVELLLKFKADLGIQDNEGSTAKDVAADDFIKELLL